MKIDKAPGPEVRCTVWVGGDDAFCAIYDQRDIGEYDRLLPKPFLIAFFKELVEQMTEDEIASRQFPRLVSK
jgi:hypothetical protein